MNKIEGEKKKAHSFFMRQAITFSFSFEAGKTYTEANIGRDLFIVKNGQKSRKTPQKMNE